jgi:uncharacterized membrane protein
MTLDPILLEWLNFGLRWLHVIAGIAWIGSSFYFIALDMSLRKAAHLPAGVSGETWQVHGGGFYRMQKYVVAPPELPEKLTWFKWEAYTTWLSGAALMMALYYAKADLYLIDPAVLPLTPLQAIAISIGSLLAGYLVYEALCRSALGQDDRTLAIVGFILLVFTAWGYSRVFSGRGAFIHVGVLIGTIMVASVAHVIIPNQRKVVAALVAGRTPEPRLGQEAKQRSLHNNYLTLPVIFVMISNHYPLAFASRFNWLILSIIILMGFVIRHFFNAHHKGLPAPWWTWGVAAVGFAVVVCLTLLTPATVAARDAHPSFADAENIVMGRCSMCHASQPAWAGIAVAPKGVMLDTPALIRRHAEEIELQAVLTHAMPPGNITDITPEERQVLAAWVRDGARAE